MNHLTIFFIFSFLASLSHATVDDFCVGDLSLPKGPAGYSCKDPANVTTDDFVYTGFRIGGPTNNTFRNSVTLAFADAFPGLNGLGLAMARLDLGVGGVVPVHSHRTLEVIIVVRGRIIAGFFDTNNNAYYRTLREGDVMIFPEAMLHFQVNAGRTPALAFVSLNSANPGIQLASQALFGNNMPDELVEQITLVNKEEVARLKRIFG